MNTKATKRILMVAAPRSFQHEELFEPMEYFKKRGAEVTVASTVSGEAIISSQNKAIVPDISTAEANAEDYDAIAIAGGGGSRIFLWLDPHLEALVKKAYTLNKVIGAICLSPRILGKAGLLKGKKATVYPDDEAMNDMKKYGVILEDAGVVVSDRIVTGKNPDWSLEYAQRIWEKLL